MSEEEYCIKGRRPLRKEVRTKMNEPNSSEYVWDQKLLRRNQINKNLKPLVCIECQTNNEDLYEYQNGYICGHCNLRITREFTPESISESIPRETNFHATNAQNEQINPHRKDKAEENANSILLYLLCLLGSVILVVLAMNYHPNILNMFSPIKYNVEDEVSNLQKVFPSQGRDIWYGVYTALNKSEPTVSVMVILYPSKSSTTGCFAQKVADSFSRVKQVSIGSVSFDIDVPGKADYGEYIQHYEKEMGVKKVMIVQDLNNLPATIARMFHALCDDVTPFIHPSFYIFTIPHKGLGSTNKVKAAAEILRSAWKYDIPENDLDPLLARVVRNVVQVVDEKQNPCDARHADMEKDL